jgi:hypothetical protein
LNDGELVTADARNRVRLTQEPAKPIGYLLDEEVSGSVSVGIVDQLESIEIKHQQRKLLFIAPEPPDGTIKPVLQKCPVGETGKWIMNCLVLRAGLSVLQLYDKLHQRPVKQGHDEYGSDGGRKQDRPNGGEEFQSGRSVSLHHDGCGEIRKDKRRDGGSHDRRPKLSRIPHAGPPLVKARYTQAVKNIGASIRGR